MPKRTSNHRRERTPDTELDVAFSVSDEDFTELAQLIGEAVERMVIWEDSVIDALVEGELANRTSDIDVYLGNGVRFELYAVLCYPGLDEDPLNDADPLNTYLDALVAAGLRLEDVAVDTEDDLVLVVSTTDTTLYLNAGAWTLDEWQELPE